MMKSFFITLGLIPSLAMASLNYSNRGITDDIIAESIKAPSPPSVTKLIEVLRNKKKTMDIEELDLSGNNIALQGAAQILTFIGKELPQLKRLNLSANQLRDWRGNKEYENFENFLIQLLRNPKVEAVNLRGNPVFNRSWIEALTSKIYQENGIEVASKLNWTEPLPSNAFDNNNYQFLPYSK